MKGPNRKLTATAFGIGFFVYFSLLCGGLLVISMPVGLPADFLLMLIYGWIVFAFVHYREGRQEEMTHLLCTAAESHAPLAPALWAYLEDRPRGTLREFWTASLLFFLLPGYYWFWHRRHRYEQKVARVAQFLEMGDSLPDALRANPGVVSPAMVLAAEIGEVTGRLADSLRSSLPRRLTPLWLEMAPRFLYPIILVLFLTGLTTFWTTNIYPRMERIYADFGQQLPEATQRLIHLREIAMNSIGFVQISVMIGGSLFAVFLLSSTLRWYFPILGRLYRRHQQSNVLKMLGVLLKVDMPAPRAINLLARSDFFAETVRRRLRKVGRLVQEGGPLADSLRQAGLLHSSTAPLVQAAERVRNLPWALAELGETLAERTTRFLRRTSQFFFPLLVMAVGLLVGVTVLGIFMPIIDLVTRLAE